MIDGQNVMMERIQEWKDAHKEEPRELDFDFFCSIVDRVNESSPGEGRLQPDRCRRRLDTRHAVS